MEFRRMRHIRKRLKKEECIRILKEEPRGVLSVISENGYPYGFPINHWYCEENGKIYFHSSKKGHKIDSLKENNKVSLCVYDEGFRNEGEWALNIKSVIVFGKIRFVEDYEESIEICRKLSLKFTSDEEYIEQEIKHSGKLVQVLELTPEQITGKIVKES